MEIVQCNESFAVIGTGDGSSGYVLEAVERSKVQDYILFSIYTKFEYKSETPEVLQAANRMEEATSDQSNNPSAPPPRSSPSSSNNSEAELAASSQTRAYVRMSRG